MNQEKIGKYIAQKRREKKLTQEDLAKRLNITDKAISKWENGRCMPDISLLEKLSEELNVTINEIIKGEDILNKDLIDKTDDNLKNCLEENKKLKIIRKNIIIALVLAILLYPVCLLTLGELTSGPIISFSSFDVIKKANTFYKSLQNNDYDNLKRILSTHNDLWHTSVTNYNTDEFVNNLKNADINFTSFNPKSFYNTGNNAVVEYKLCFESSYNNGCLNLIMSNDGKDKLIFYAIVFEANDLEEKMINIFNPYWNVK